MLLTELNILGNPDASVLTERGTGQPQKPAPVPSRPVSDCGSRIDRQNGKGEDESPRKPAFERQNCRVDWASAPKPAFERQNCIVGPPAAESEEYERRHAALLSRSAPNPDFSRHNCKVQPTSAPKPASERQNCIVPRPTAASQEYDRQHAALLSRSAPKPAFERQNGQAESRNGSSERGAVRHREPQPLARRPNADGDPGEIGDYRNGNGWAWSIPNPPQQVSRPTREVFQARSTNLPSPTQQAPQGQTDQRRAHMPKARARLVSQFQQKSTPISEARPIAKLTADSRSPGRPSEEFVMAPNTGLAAQPSGPGFEEPGSFRSTGTHLAAPVPGSSLSSLPRSSRPSNAFSPDTTSYGTARPAAPPPSSDGSSPTTGPARIYQPTRFFRISNSGLEPTNASLPGASDRSLAGSGGPATDRSPQNPSGRGSTPASASAPTPGRPSRPQWKAGQPTRTSASTTRNPATPVVVGGATNLAPDMLHKYLDASVQVAQSGETRPPPLEGGAEGKGSRAATGAWVAGETNGKGKEKEKAKKPARKLWR